MRTMIMCVVMVAASSSTIGCSASRDVDYCAELRETFVHEADVDGDIGFGENAYVCPWTTPATDAQYTACDAMIRATTTLNELRAALDSCE